MKKVDYVWGGQEKKKVEMARKLGFEGVVFLYQKEDKIKEIKAKDFEIDFGIVFEDFKKKDKGKIESIKSKGWELVVKAREKNLNRFILEKTKADMVYGLEWSNKKDSLHYRKSGLDQVLCKIAKEKGKKIGLSFSSLLRERKKSLILGRMAFNLKLCGKYGVECRLISLASDVWRMRSGNDFKRFSEFLESF